MNASAVVKRIDWARSHPSFKTVSVAALILLLTAIITYAGIQASLEFGRLSIPPTYDDVAYITAAARWLTAWSSRSLVVSLLALLGDHAPFSTLTAVAGFLLTPDSYVGHYAINAIVVAGFMSGVAALVWRSNLADIAICLTGIACFPLMVQAINEARPDLPWGFASGLAIGAIVYAPIQRRSLPAVAMLGLACGLAALIKPSALPVSLACFGGVFLISSLGDRFDSGSLPTPRDAALRVLIFGLGVVIALVPYLSVSFIQIAEYIWRTLVENRALWALDAGLYDHAVFYSFGPVGHLALHEGLPVGLGLFAARLALGAYLRSKDLVRALVLLSAGVVTYAIPSISVVKSYFLGAMFYGALIVSTALNFSAIVVLIREAIGDRSLDRGWAFTAFRVIVIAVLAGVFARAMFLKDAELATTFDQGTRQDVRASSETVWPILRGLALEAGNAPGRQLVVSFSSPFPVNPILIELYAQRSQIPLSVREEFFHARLDDALRSLTTADVVVVPSSLPHNLPTPRMGDDIIRALDARSDLCALQTVSLPDNRVLRIYRKADQGC